MKPFRTVLTVMILAVLTAYGTVKLAVPHSTKLERQESVFDKVLRTRTLRCGYVAYAPYLIKDPNTGNLSGMFYDLTEKMGRLLNLKIEWVYETSFATLLEDTKVGRFDVFCSNVWPESSKAHSLRYTIPVNYVGLNLYSRADDMRFEKQNTSRLNDPAYIFSTMDGEMSQLVKNEDFPHAKEVAHAHMTDASVLMLDVVNKKADLVLVEKPVASDFLLNNPNSLKEVTDKPIRLFGNTWSVKIEEDRLVSMMNTAIQEMLNTGFVDKTVKKYEKAPGSFYPVAVPYKQSEN